MQFVWNSFRPAQPFQLKDLKISPFSIPHDAVDPLGFTLEAEGIKIAHVTDLGYMTELVIQKLIGMRRDCAGVES